MNYEELTRIFPKTDPSFLRSVYTELIEEAVHQAEVSLFEENALTEPSDVSDSTPVVNSPCTLCETDINTTLEDLPARKTILEAFDYSTRLKMAEEFLNILFAPYPLDEGLTCEIRCLGEEDGHGKKVVTSQWFGLGSEFLKKAALYAIEQSETMDVYAGVLPRTGRKGNELHIPSSGWIWAEIDRGEGTDEEVRGLIRAALSLSTPRMFVQSGSGGGHLYFPLPTLESVKQRHREGFKSVLKGLVEYLNTEAKVKEVSNAHAHADNACVDTARILRIPGTLNHKWEIPQPVKLIKCRAETKPIEFYKARVPFVPCEWDTTRMKAGLKARGVEMVSNGYIPPATLQWADTPAPVGGRHKEIAAWATHMAASQSLPPETILDLCLKKAANSGGMPPHEIQQLVDSAVRKFYTA